MKQINVISLGNALIWAAAILAVSIILRWSANEGMAVIVLGGAAGASILLVNQAFRKD